MGMSVGGKKQSMDEINITPLIDVVLVLLIIFMVLLPVTVQKMASQLPPEDTEDTPPPPPDQPPDQLMVAIYKDGTLALNLKSLDDASMRTEVTNRLKARAKKTVFIDAHPDANYARVIEIMDVVRECGAEHVGFADMKVDGPLAPVDPNAVPDPNAAPILVPAPQ